MARPQSRFSLREPQSRFRAHAFIAAFTLIIVLTIAEGIDDGFSVWDYLVMAVGVVFIIQSILRLKDTPPGPS